MLRLRSAVGYRPVIQQQPSTETPLRQGFFSGDSVKSSHRDTIRQTAYGRLLPETPFVRANVP